MATVNIEQRLKTEQQTLEKIQTYSYTDEINQEIEAYRLKVEKKYAEIKNTEIVKAEARISLLKELQEEAEQESIKQTPIESEVEVKSVV